MSIHNLTERAAQLANETQALVVEYGGEIINRLSEAYWEHLSGPLIREMTDEGITFVSENKLLCVGVAISLVGNLLVAAPGLTTGMTLNAAGFAPQLTAGSWAAWYQTPFTVAGSPFAFLQSAAAGNTANLAALNGIAQALGGTMVGGGVGLVMKGVKDSVGWNFSESSLNMKDLEEVGEDIPTGEGNAKSKF